MRELETGIMKLKKLLRNIQVDQVKGSKEIEITGVSSHSKQITHGNLFIAKKGKSDDGARYIGEAIASGAHAILTDIYDPFLKDVVQIIHSNPAAIESQLVAEFYRYPANELMMVGITGTNGKTTTSYIVKSLLDLLYGPCGLIGTVEYIVGRHRYEATRTTPDITLNYKMLREMVLQGCRSAVMEVTSHALDQGRVDKIDFDVAVFTNLTLDHLDYHTTMDNYCNAKNLLFKNLGKEKTKKKQPKTAIVNVDSTWTPKIIKGCSSQIITYGIESPCDLRASNIVLEKNGTTATVTYKGEEYRCFWPLIGRFNVYNALAAMAVGLSRQFQIQKIIDCIAKIPPVRGRLERVPNDKGYQIFVDFAHSDDALIKVLECLKELKQKRIITIFGCGGERDIIKRPKMAEASEKYSDYTIVTSDNPRNENPIAICDAIVRGFKNRDSYSIEMDRKEAIRKAIQMATVNDIILIAGKGHETYQIFANKTVKFDDCQVAAELCSGKE